MVLGNQFFAPFLVSNPSCPSTIAALSTQAQVIFVYNPSNLLKYKFPSQESATRVPQASCRASQVKKIPRWLQFRHPLQGSSTHLEHSGSQSFATRVTGARITSSSAPRKNWPLGVVAHGPGLCILSNPSPGPSAQDFGPPNFDIIDIWTFYVGSEPSTRPGAAASTAAFLASDTRLERRYYRGCSQ